MPKPPHHYKNHPNPLHHGWMENEEKTRNLEEIGERLQRIGTLLSEKGQFKLGKSRIAPPPECVFIIRYERMPRGELSLKLELQWEDTNRQYNFPRGDEDLKIED